VDRHRRIASYLVIPVLLTVGFALVWSGRDQASGGDTQVLGASLERDALADGAGGGPAARGPLPTSDPGGEPVPARGVYRDGVVVLSGSVPDEAAAAGYAAKLGSVLGEANVVVELSVDPRVPAGPMPIEVDQAFRFPSTDTAFDPQLQPLLDLGAAALRLLPETTLVVTGHTDDVGDEGTNLALSQARAQVVVDVLTERGIAPERLEARGAGESQPIADNATPEGRDANRRIEAVLEGLTPG
jgi:outer membrane protein OmpA-like peptidoglycan-associated protein